MHRRRARLLRRFGRIINVGGPWEVQEIVNSASAYPRNRYFKGRMQDFRIYSGALDTKAIAEPAH